MTKEVAKNIPTLDQRTIGPDEIFYCHLFGVIGDWYISRISKDRKTAFGYQNIIAEKEWEMESLIPNQKQWGEFSISNLQAFVNEKFLKELDIRFLIVRDTKWVPTKFSSINLDKSTLNYPGSIN